MQTRVESEEEGSRLSRRSLQCAPESASQTPPPWASSSRTSGDLPNKVERRRKPGCRCDMCVDWEGTGGIHSGVIYSGQEKAAQAS